ncbi:MAG TPA: cation:proton antiporter [Candidatus Methylomirabilis sp.]|nr:cation:proton antiporter [Candidatus Methylomirabilis sp.]
MATIVVALMSILAVGFLGTWAASRLRVPHSVFLVILGVAAGMAIRGHAGATSTYIGHLTEVFPDLVVLVLLPPLIFEAAYGLDFDQLRIDLLPLTALSIVALGLSTAFIGYGLHWVFRLELLPSLTFGALISATDPIAVVALFKEVGAPRRLSTLVEGESLLNDGTAIMLFRVLLAATAASQIGEGLIVRGVLQFIEVAVGGALVGLGMAAMMSLLLRLTSGSGASQLGVTVVAAYLSFIVADHYLHVSGVIATMAVGLYLGRRARLELNRDALDGMRHIWEFLALSANVVVFVAVGLAADPAAMWINLAVIPTTVGIVYLARALSVFLTIPAVNALRRSPPISIAYQVVLFWGGLRGGLALGLVLVLPAGFPHKQLFAVLAIAVVTATLLINALSTKRVLRMLELDQLEPDDQRFYVAALDLAQGAAFEQLSRAADTGSLSQVLIDQQRASVREALGAARNVSEDAPQSAPQEIPHDPDVRFSVSSLLLHEQRIYDQRLADGVLSKDAYGHLHQLVANRLDAFSREGLDGLTRFTFGLGAQSRDELRGSPRSRFFSRRVGGWLHRLTIRLEVLLHLKLALDDMAGSSFAASLRGLIRQWLVEADLELQTFFRAYPHYAAAVQASFIADAINARSRAVIQQLFDASIISGIVRAKAEQQVAAIHAQGMAAAKSLLMPTRAYLLGRVPIFGALPASAIEKIADFSRRVEVPPGRVVVREGEEGHSFFVVTAGLLEVQTPGESGEGRPRLFAGDYFGEASLLFDQPRSATVVAIMTSELLELDRPTFEFIVKEYPLVRAQIYETALARRRARDDRMVPR